MESYKIETQAIWLMGLPYSGSRNWTVNYKAIWKHPGGTVGFVEIILICFYFFHFECSSLLPEVYAS